MEVNGTIDGEGREDDDEEINKFDAVRWEVSLDRSFVRSMQKETGRSPHERPTTNWSIKRYIASLLFA